MWPQHALQGQISCLAYLLEAMLHFHCASCAYLVLCRKQHQWLSCHACKLLCPAMQAALQHRLERQAASLAPVREAFRLAEGPKQESKASSAGAAAAIAPAHSMRGVLSEAQFGAFCALINPAIKPREVSVLLAAMAPGGARQACPRAHTTVVWCDGAVEAHTHC